MVTVFLCARGVPPPSPLSAASPFASLAAVGPPAPALCPLKNPSDDISASLPPPFRTTPFPLGSLTAPAEYRARRFRSIFRTHHAPNATATATANSAPTTCPASAFFLAVWGAGAGAGAGGGSGLLAAFTSVRPALAISALRDPA